MSRNPDVKTKIGKRIDYKRINGASPEAITSWFDLYDQFDWIKPEKIYNTDETGIMEGQGINGLVLRSSEVNPKATYVKSNQSRAWTTIVESISASGRSLTPLVIFKGASVQVQWFAREFKEKWQYT